MRIKLKKVVVLLSVLMVFASINSGGKFGEFYEYYLG